MNQIDPPHRAFRLTLKLEADNLREMAMALEHIAGTAERGELTTGVSGGVGNGYIYELLHDPAQTHAKYFEAVHEYLDSLKKPNIEPTLETKT